MNQKPLFLTNFALTRLLKELLIDMGLSDTKADVLAQVHLQMSTIPAQWSEFLATNCSSCKWNPNHCRFLNPGKKNCLEGVTPPELRAAHAMMIETGRSERCPAWTKEDPE